MRATTESRDKQKERSVRALLLLCAERNEVRGGQGGRTSFASSRLKQSSHDPSQLLLFLTLLLKLFLLALSSLSSSSSPTHSALSSSRRRRASRWPSSSAALGLELSEPLGSDGSWERQRKQVSGCKVREMLERGVYRCRRRPLMCGK